MSIPPNANVAQLISLSAGPPNEVSESAKTRLTELRALDRFGFLSQAISVIVEPTITRDVKIECYKLLETTMSPLTLASVSQFKEDWSTKVSDNLRQQLKTLVLQAVNESDTDLRDFAAKIWAIIFGVESTQWVGGISYILQTLNTPNITNNAYLACFKVFSHIISQEIFQRTLTSRDLLQKYQLILDHCFSSLGKQPLNSNSFTVRIEAAKTLKLSVLPLLDLLVDHTVLMSYQHFISTVSVSLRVAEQPDDPQSLPLFEAVCDLFNALVSANLPTLFCNLNLMFDSLLPYFESTFPFGFRKCAFTTVLNMTNSLLEYKKWYPNVLPSAVSALLFDTYAPRMFEWMAEIDPNDTAIENGDYAHSKRATVILTNLAKFAPSSFLVFLRATFSEVSAMDSPPWTYRHACHMLFANADSDLGPVLSASLFAFTVNDISSDNPRLQETALYAFYHLVKFQPVSDQTVDALLPLLLAISPDTPAMIMYRLMSIIAVLSQRLNNPTPNDNVICDAVIAFYEHPNIRELSNFSNFAAFVGEFLVSPGFRPAKNNVVTRLIGHFESVTVADTKYFEAFCLIASALAADSEYRLYSGLAATFPKLVSAVINDEANRGAAAGALSRIIKLAGFRLDQAQINQMAPVLMQSLCTVEKEDTYCILVVLVTQLYIKQADEMTNYIHEHFLVITDLLHRLISTMNALKIAGTLQSIGYIFRTLANSHALTDNERDTMESIMTFFCNLNLNPDDLEQHSFALDLLSYINSAFVDYANGIVDAVRPGHIRGLSGKIRKLFTLAMAHVQGMNETTVMSVVSMTNELVRHHGRRLNIILNSDVTRRFFDHWETVGGLSPHNMTILRRLRSMLLTL